jgi:hypothetical protein
MTEPWQCVCDEISRRALTELAATSDRFQRLTELATARAATADGGVVFEFTDSANGRS